MSRVRFLTSLPATSRIIALFVFSAATLGGASPLLKGQPTEKLPFASIPGPERSSVPLRADAIGLEPSSLSTPNTPKLNASDTLRSRVPGRLGVDLPSPRDGRVSPASPKRWRALRDELTSPAFLLGSLGPAIGDHLNDDPASWRGGALGYGVRVGSNAGRLLLEGGAAHGLAAATYLDLQFRPRGHGSMASRFRYAALEAVTARTPSGMRIPNAPRLIGTYGAALAQQRWQYGQLRPGDAALSTALSLGIDVAVNVITEFAGTP